MNQILFVTCDAVYRLSGHTDFPRLWCHLKMDQNDGSIFSTHPFELKIYVPKILIIIIIFSHKMGSIGKCFWTRLLSSMAEVTNKQLLFFLTDLHVGSTRPLNGRRRRYRIVANIFMDFIIMSAYHDSERAERETSTSHTTQSINECSRYNLSD